MALAHRRVGFTGAVIAEISSLRLGLITVLFPFGLSATRYFMAFLFLATAFSATVFIGTEFLVASVYEMHSTAGVYGEIGHLFLQDTFLSDTYCPTVSVQEELERLAL